MPDTTSNTTPDRQRDYSLYFRMKASYHYRFCVSHIIRIGKMQRYILENVPVHIQKDNLLYGGKNQFTLTEEQKKEYDILESWYQSVPPTVRYEPASTYHRVLDYEKLLHLGVCEIQKQIQNLQAKIDYSDPQDCEKAYLYSACADALSGFLSYANRVAEAYAQAAEEESDTVICKRLHRLAEIFRNIPAEPARNFYEALQSMWLLQYVSSGFLEDITLTGRPSDYLYPYYKNDIANGSLDDNFAQQLIDDLYYRHNDLYKAWPAAIMVGGVNRNGDPVWNELSYMFIKAIEHTKQVNPSVAICYNEFMPNDLLKLCVETIAKGYTRPSFFNDRLITEGLIRAGVSVEDARYYIHSTCVEITPIAASQIQVATPYININKAIEMVLNNGNRIWGASPEILEPANIVTDSLDTFEKFFNAVLYAMTLLIRAAVIRDIRSAEENKHFRAAPLSDCFLNDCLSRGKDCGAGGAKYNFFYPCFPGFINLIDSVAAIKKVVYDDHIYTLRHLYSILANNFEGEERTRQFLLNRCPKFGNNNAEADSIAQLLYTHIYTELSKYKVSLPNGSFFPSYFAWIMHGKLGRETAASADGRKQGEAISESLGAAQGRDKNGPLAVIHSISKLDQTHGIGGIATNFRFSKSLVQSSAGIEAITQLIKTFMAARNFECQFNVVDQATLLKAKENPNAYKNLLVRVAGYSDYFVNLDPIIQDEIITRTEHNSV